MKISISIITFCFINLYTFAQDVIVKKDGTKIEAKVLEITPSTVRYRNFTQPEGPDRVIAISSLKEIIYEDGQFDDFSKNTEPSTPETTGPTRYTPVTRAETTPSKPPVPLLLRSGFFIDGLVGYSQLNRTQGNYGYYDNNGNYYYNPTNYITNNIYLGFRLGTKWYFGQREKWRPGLQVNWVRLGINMDPNDPESILIGPKNFSIGNIGMSNIFQFNEKLGLELNFTTGLNVGVDLDSGRADVGLSIAPEVKFRIGRLAIGLDYQRIQGMATTESFRADHWNTYSISIGAKF